MAEFAEYVQRLKLHHPGNAEMLKQHPEQNPDVWEGLIAADFSVLDIILAHQQPELPASYGQNLLNDFHPDTLNAEPIVHTVTSNQNVLPGSKKRKEVDQTSSTSKNISFLASAANSRKKDSIGKSRKETEKEKEVHKAEQVIHVRAKRGHATDSHSIAERVRREKINSKLRCLQDLVPGCHKSMGMALMLEEIINYVHSLQNQVEFLSMQLGAAACSSDQNLETASFRKAQGTNSSEAQEMHRLLREQCGDFSCFHSAWPI